MTNDKMNLADTLIHLLALAVRLEGEGQYNLAKLARAAADSLSRQAAYQVTVPSTREALAADIKRTAEALASLDVSGDLLSALMQGAEVMAEGGLPLFSLIPHPYVCRSCGHLILAEPTETCPTCGAWSDTYQRFMPNYWFDALEPPAAMQRLRQTPAEVEKLLEGLSDAQLDWQPPDKGWAMRNILTHLRDAQGVLAFRLDLFRQEENPALEAKAVWTWAADEAERPFTARDIFAVYKAARAETVAGLEQLPLTHWWRTGRHAEFGVVTLRQQVSYFAAHEVTHLSQMESLRRYLVGQV
jgi:rRNA maturation endonuclease Nob1